MRLAYFIVLLPFGSFAQEFAPECPREAIAELIEDPGTWADHCFMAVTGRPPDTSNVGETVSDSRDIDLDGGAEHIEIRGTGNASKIIYVFRQVESGFEYLGSFNAHPSFVVARDSEGVPTIEYVHRFGVDDEQLKRIQYVDGRFLEVPGVGP